MRNALSSFLVQRIDTSFLVCPAPPPIPQSQSKRGDRVPSSNPRYANYSARSALRKRMASQPQRCWMCGLPISPTYPARHPYALELDEIVPISKGGSAIDPANVRAAHRCCNQWRGDKPVCRVQSIATATRSAFGAWRSPAEFVLFARSAAKGAMKANQGAIKAQVSCSRRW